MALDDPELHFIRMKYIFSPIVFLGIFWLLLSGHYTILLLCLGAASCIWVTRISRRMDVADHKGHPIHLVSPRIIPYYLWLGKEIVVSSFVVARMILSSNKKLSPAVARFPVDGMNDMEKVIYANSITLTPGTLTLEVSNSSISVHTIQEDMLESLEKGVMSSRVMSVAAHPKPEL